MEGILADVRSGCRALRASPGLTVLAILTLVLGIGANGAVFSVVNAVLLVPLRHADPDRLVMLWEVDRRGSTDLEMTLLSNYADFRAGSESFQAMAAWGRPALLTLTGRQPVLELSGCEVTAGLFPALGVAPQLGRTFLPEEETPGRDRVVVFSHDLWQSMFGASQRVIGTTLMLGGSPFQVVGVLPPGFRHPSGAVDLWLPLAMSPNEIDVTSARVEVYFDDHACLGCTPQFDPCRDDCGTVPFQIDNFAFSPTWGLGDSEHTD